MRRLLLISLACLISYHPSFAQEGNDSLEHRGLKFYKKPYPPAKGDLFILAVPIIGYNPSNGVLIGAGAAASAFLGDPSTTGISSSIVSATYTSKKQLLINIRSTLFTKGNKWILSGDWRFLNTSMPTYGLGTGPQSSKLASNGFEIGDNLFSQRISGEQMMSFKQIRFYETVSREVWDHFYLGIGYHLDMFMDMEDNLLDLSADPPVITSFYAYNYKYGFDQKKNTLSGISLNASYDSRDNQNNAYEGQYINLSFHINPEFLGSDINSTMLYTEYRTFIDITKNHHNMLCFWGIGNFLTSGDTPALVLPAIGEDQYGKSGRAYTQGRFRGQSMLYGEAEFRKHLLATKKSPDFLGMVVFLNAVTATNRDAEVGLFEYVNIGAGAGLRIMASKNARMRLGIDYGWGNYGSSGFYVRMNETF